METLHTISNWAIPLILLIIPTLAFMRGVKVYEAFVKGARQGFDTAVNIIPYLVAMLVAVEVFQASGAMEVFTDLLSPIGSLLGIPEEVIPMTVIRPLSGSGSLGVLSQLLSRYGPDSPLGMLASCMQGSTETTMYVLAVYFGSVGIKRVRHCVVVGLLADLTSFIAALFFTGLFLGK